MAGRTVYRVVFFLPMILSSVAVGMVWRPLLGSSDVGLVNPVLSLIGIGAVLWLSSSTWAMPSLIGVAIWKEMGYFMVIFLTGLQGIPRTYYEAADIDGAGRPHRWRGVRTGRLYDQLERRQRALGDTAGAGAQSGEARSMT